MQYVSDRGVSLIAEFEGFRPRAYQDIVGVWTLGHGLTRIHGRKVQPGDEISEEESFEALRAEAEDMLSDCLEEVSVELNQNQLDALASFIYNVGPTNFKKSTMLKLLNAGNYDGAAEQFIRWNRAGGREVAGLTRRRLAERDLFLE